MRRTCVYPVSMMAVVFAIVATSGCATVSSFDVPWKKPTDRSEAATDSDTIEDDQSEASNDDAVADARYWAKKAISASNQIAYAQHIRSVSERNPELLAEHAPESPNSSESADTHNANGKEPSPPGQQVSSETDSTSEASANTASTSTTSNSPKVRKVRRKNNDRDVPTVGSDVWPVALEQSYGSTERNHMPVDPTLDTEIFDLSEAEARETISEQFGIDLPDADSAVAIPGTYLQPAEFEEFRDDEFKSFNGISEEQQRNQVAVIVPGERIVIYAGSEEIASRDFESDADFPSELATVRPIRVVDDGTIQLLTYWSDTDEETETVRYKAGIFKVIGPFVGTLFQESVAERHPDDGSELQRKGYVDFVSGDNQTHLRWIPADDEGQPDIERTDILEWNPWEGVFRVPEPPPTAPDQRS